MVAPSISTQAKGANIERSYPDIMLDAVCVTILIAYFLRFALPALRGGFRGDEMVNMGICWHAGALKSLLANIVFWKVFYVAGVALYDLPLYLYRPGGALYYLPLYHVLWAGSFALSDRPDQHSRCIHSAGLLLEPASRVLALSRLSRCPCVLLQPAPCQPCIRWCVHLRRVMWVLLPRGTDLLCPSSGAGYLPASRATIDISTSVRSGARQQGDGSYASSHRFNLRVSEISPLAGLESILALDPLLWRTVADCWITHGLLSLRENARQRLAGKFRSLSAPSIHGTISSRPTPSLLGNCCLPDTRSIQSPC